MRFPRLKAYASTLLAASLALSARGQTDAVSSLPVLYCQTTSCVARTGASAGSPRSFRLGRGDEVRRVSEHGAWVRVQDGNAEGWVPAAFLGETPPGDLPSTDRKASSAPVPLKGGATEASEYRPDFRALERLEASQPEARQVRRFRNEGGLEEP